MDKERWLGMLVLASMGVAAHPALAAPPSDGGASVPPDPEVLAVRCLAEPDAPCPRSKGVVRGHLFTIVGQGLGSAVKVVFQGGRGVGDDVVARPTRVDDRVVTGRVPRRARTGKVVVADSYGRSASSRLRVPVGAAPQAAPVDVSPGSRFFFDGRRRPSFQFEVSRAALTQVELVAVDSGTVVRTWEVSAVTSGPNRVVWNGRLGATAAPAGAYSFRLAASAAGARQTSDSAAPNFNFADHLFPIRGRHNLGFTATNGFGGGRGHKGQDMFARCGTPLAAARGGRVQYAGYHAAAGYYAVIDGVATGRDYVYMHMRERALVATGDRVFTGQEIGEVGETGRATGCHLHFEMWSAPGWYEGGRAFDPLPALRGWDQAS